MEIESNIKITKAQIAKQESFPEQIEEFAQQLVLEQQ